MKRVLIAILLALLLILGALLWFFLPELLNIDRSGWRTTENGICYLNADGDPVSGWYTVDGAEYYFSPETCTLHTGWVSRDSGRCYAVEGRVVIGWKELENGRYYFAADGTMHTGWLEENNLRWYLRSDGTAASGWEETDRGRCWFDETGKLCTGIVTTADGIYCFREDGNRHSGWYDHEGKRYYFHQDGTPYTGWLEENTQRYYLKEDGSAAVGKLEIDGQIHYFSSTGATFILVNRWNPLPEEYKPNYVFIEGHAIDPICKEALAGMLADCRAAGNNVQILSAYRSYRDQGFNYNNAVWARVHKGYTLEEAKELAAMNVAVAGTSEHQLGMAVDLVDPEFPELEQFQEFLATQQWLMEHCWDYGFILRYPEGTTDFTGIVYEPWHYRYVGVEMAKELQELGICLEEYIDMLTGDGSSCNDQDPVAYELYAPYYKKSS